MNLQNDEDDYTVYTSFIASKNMYMKTFCSLKETQIHIEVLWFSITYMPQILVISMLWQTILFNHLSRHTWNSKLYLKLTIFLSQQFILLEVPLLTFFTSPIADGEKSEFSHQIAMETVTVFSACKWINISSTHTVWSTDQAK